MKVFSYIQIKYESVIITSIKFFLTAGRVSIKLSDTIYSHIKKKKKGKYLKFIHMM